MPYLTYREAKSVNKMLQKSVLKIGDHSTLVSHKEDTKTVNRLAFVFGDEYLYVKIGQQHV